MRFVKLNLNDSVNLVLDECLIYWKKARIPTHVQMIKSKNVKYYTNPGDHLKK